jgi:hypothetical protein
MLLANGVSRAALVWSLPRALSGMEPIDFPQTPKIVALVQKRLALRGLDIRSVT